MNTDFRELLPQDFDESARVWIYQSNRVFTLHEALQIEDILKNFTNGWNTHGTPVKGYANLFFGQFIVFIADEVSAKVSGCSTDSSVSVVREIGELYQVNLFDRLLLAFIVKERVQMIPMAQLAYALDNGFLQSDTLYFNNTVQTLGQLKADWMMPIHRSWLAKDSRFHKFFAESASSK